MLLDTIRKSKSRIILISSISALAGLANIGLLALINQNARASSVGSSAALLYATGLAGMVLLSFVSQFLLSRLSARTFYELRERLVHSVIELSPEHIERLGASRILAALTRDIPAVHELVIVLPNYVFNLTVSLACLVYLASLSLPLFAVFTVFLTLALSVSKFAIANRAEAKFQIRRNVEDELFRCYRAVIEGNKELKMNHARKEDFKSDDLRRHAEAYRQATVAAETLWNLSSNWGAAVIFVAIGALVFLSPQLGMASGSEVVAFVVVIFYMVGPLTVLMNAFRTVHGAKVGIAKLRELQLGDELPGTGLVTGAVAPFSALELDNAEFRYVGSAGARDTFVLGPLNLTVRRGEIVYFVGGNGSGKTTAAKLLSGLYPCDGGAVRVNGAPLSREAGDLQRFSAVFQDYFLFEKVMPKSGLAVEPPEIQRMVERLGLGGKVTVDSGRLVSAGLSVGQRKRLALLVAYFDESEIYVFDEWAADQDPEFRDYFYREFLPDLRRRGKTVIAVTHDDRYFHLADRVVKFDAGRIESVTTPVRVGAAQGEPLAGLQV